jgi:hypothetical protein
MPAFSIEQLHAWHDFYVFTGTAAASLIGAMFVVASIGGGYLMRDRMPEIRAFLTPTVSHLSTALALAALVLVPSWDEPGLAAVLAFAGLIGLCYSGLVGWRIGRRRIEAGDRIWYGALPVAAYLVMTAAGAMIVARSTASLDVLAIVVALLLLVGIRNAWDLILFFVAQPRGPN